MAGETQTPNIGLQVPAFNQPNWQVPIDYDLNLLDLLLGGQIKIPSLWVGTLIVDTANIPGVIAAIIGAYKSEALPGSIPGTTFMCSAIPVLIFGVWVNGLWQRPGLDYTQSGNQIITSYSLSLGDNIYAAYLHN
jgi:hypothetical protein